MKPQKLERYESQDDMNKLTPRQQRFVEEFLVDLNATQAAVRAGYSAKTANAQVGRLLVNVGIQAAIAEARDARSERTEIKADMVVQELARVAFSNMADYVTWGPDGVKLKSSGDLTEKQSRAVVEVTETVTESRSTIKFKLHDKKGALDSLAKHLCMFIERNEITGRDCAPLTVWDVLKIATDDNY